MSLAVCALALPLQSAPTEPMIRRVEVIFERAPFPSCHASTLAETEHGLVAAWFGGTEEKHPDVGIWVSRQAGDRWTPPVEVANGLQAGGKSRHPCWNPVLFKVPGRELLLFYKVGPSPSTWWGMLQSSTNGGRSWTEARRLPEGILGPIKNKPILLSNGDLLCPSSTEHAGWTIHLERSPDLGVTWAKTPPLNSGRDFGAIQPTILTHPSSRLQLLCRSQQRKITECWSEDGGSTWGPMRATDLPNPNAGLDGVTLRDGRHLLVYNHTPKGRTPLNVAVSRDGRAWRMVVDLERDRGEYSYPAVIQTGDGMVHITYTWKRQRIKHVMIDPSLISAP